MRTLGSVFRFSCLLLIGLWFVKIYRFYFEFTHADRISIFLCLLAPFFILSWIVRQENKALKVAGALLITIIPLTLQPIVSSLLENFLYTWFIVHVLALICGAAIACLKVPQVTIALLVAGTLWWLPFDFKESQIKFSDKVAAEISTRRGEGHILKWKDNYWVHYNKKLLFSTTDAHIYQEAFIQPVMHLNPGIKSVLVIGDESGLIQSGLSGIETIEQMLVVPFDSGFHSFIKNWFKDQTQPKKLKISSDAPQFILLDRTELFDLILIDLSTITGTEAKQYQSTGFYQLCYNKLSATGLVVTHVPDIYIKPALFINQKQNIRLAKFEVLGYHAQVPAVGQCAWVIGSKSYTSEKMENILNNVEPKLQTRWWNREAMQMMLSFGNLSYFNHIAREPVFDENS